MCAAAAPARLRLATMGHGGGTSLTSGFLQAVSPELALISVGADNRFGDPDPVTLEKLGEIITYRTALLDSGGGRHRGGRAKAAGSPAAGSCEGHAVFARCLDGQQIRGDGASVAPIGCHT